MRGAMLPDDAKGSCVQLLHLYDSSGAEWQLGKTKVSKKMSHLEINVYRDHEKCEQVLLRSARFTTEHGAERVRQTNILCRI